MHVKCFLIGASGQKLISGLELRLSCHLQITRYCMGVHNALRTRKQSCYFLADQFQCQDRTTNRSTGLSRACESRNVDPNTVVWTVTRIRNQAKNISATVVYIVDMLQVLYCKYTLLVTEWNSYMTTMYNVTICNDNMFTLIKQFRRTLKYPCNVFFILIIKLKFLCRQRFN